MKPTFSRRILVSASSGNDVVVTPSTSTVPEVGKSMAPARLNSVDLPHPLRPTSATNSPREISSDKLLSARTGCSSVKQSLVTLRRTRIDMWNDGLMTVAQQPLLRHENA